MADTMRYFVPDWDDIVDPGYDFEHDRPTLAEKAVCAQIYERPNYDGLLFSKSTVEQARAKVERIQARAAFIVFAASRQAILGDCGAFSYITERSLLTRRQRSGLLPELGFTYGVSIDHLIVPAFYQEKEYRYQLTRENAREFIRLHRAGNYTFHSYRCCTRMDTRNVQGCCS